MLQNAMQKHNLKEYIIYDGKKPNEQLTNVSKGETMLMSSEGVIRSIPAEQFEVIKKGLDSLL